MAQVLHYGPFFGAPTRGWPRARSTVGRWGQTRGSLQKPVWLPRLTRSRRSTQVPRAQSAGWQ
jgi:hypothetical protein